MTTMSELFGDPISVYTVHDGIRDDVIVEAPEADRLEAGYHLPVTFTRAAWTDLVEWDDDPAQDEAGRLWDVLTMVRYAAKNAADNPGERFGFVLYRVPFRTASGARSRAQEAKRVRRDVVCQSYDRTGRPCLTILLPEES